MNKKHRRIFIIIGILLLAALFIPIPFRHDGQVLCKPCIEGAPCQPCPKEGDIGWRPSIAKRYWDKITMPEAGRSEQTEQITPPLPTEMPSSDETANWKTYTNSEFKFSLKYPVKMKVQAQAWERIGDDEKGQWRLEISDRKDGDATGLSIKEQMSVAISPQPKTNYGTPITKVEDSIIAVEPSYYKLQGYSAAKFNVDSTTVIHIFKESSLWILKGSDQILQTFQFTDQNAAAQPSPKSVIKLVYSLPSSWKTVQDKTGTFEIGYDPEIFRPLPRNLVIDFAYVQHPGSISVGINNSYDGGSRHQFIYKSLGYTQSWQVEENKTKDYYEKEYTYNGWSCLVLYGLGFSAQGTTWGMCPVSTTKAIFFSGLDEKGNEQLIQTIKLLK